MDKGNLRNEKPNPIQKIVNFNNIKKKNNKGKKILMNFALLNSKIQKKDKTSLKFIPNKKFLGRSQFDTSFYGMLCLNKKQKKKIESNLNLPDSTV
mmetsp:Transcript_13167/g.11644  ORF Transcript_13167/g.11644 Transcript_13167/m.11644 type:complete len:96 (-) Transcript_13167:78-365(-)